MENIIIFFEDKLWIFILIILILLIWNSILGLSLRKLDKRFNRFTRGSQITNLEQVIIDYTEEIKKMDKQIESNSWQINSILDKITKLKGNVEITRYNAFNEEGNDLSYSIAFLDDNGDGVVISSIYNRGEANTYAKPIKAGTSTYKLSQEEQLVIDRSLSK